MNHSIDIEDLYIQKWHQEHLDCPDKDREDGTCGHESNLTPECHEGTCPRAKKEPKVYVMNDYDTVVARTAQEAVDYYTSLTGDGETIEHPVEELSQEALEKMQIRDCDDYDAPRVSGRQALEDWIRHKSPIPEVFTSTEC